MNPGRNMISAVDFCIWLFKIVTIRSTKPLKCHLIIEIWKVLAKYKFGSNVDIIWIKLNLAKNQMKVG